MYPRTLQEPHSQNCLVSCRNVVSPVVRGAGNLPNSAVDTSRPLLLVGNHARIGLYDMPYLMIELYLRGIKVAAPSLVPHILALMTIQNTVEPRSAGRMKAEPNIPLTA